MSEPWRTPAQLAARWAARQRRKARQHAFKVGQCAAPDDVIDAINKAAAIRALGEGCK